jgi:hypothetical protein
MSWYLYLIGRQESIVLVDASMSTTDENKKKFRCNATRFPLGGRHPVGAAESLRQGFVSQKRIPLGLEFTWTSSNWHRNVSIGYSLAMECCLKITRIHSDIA